MKSWAIAAAAGGFLIVAAQAQGSGETAPPAGAAVRADDPGDWTRPLGDPQVTPASASAEPEPGAQPEIDVVDAHWMALTMWGEARNQGDEGMRAVGHVIHNRWLAEKHGAYVTDTVSKAWQFSCWNEGDPNRQAMLDIDLLPRDSADHRLWVEARALADEILSGRSSDPTGGALFYHTEAVQPAWSRGVTPVARIGSHLFFASAR